jgi:hypothetical protein
LLLASAALARLRVTAADQLKLPASRMSFFNLMLATQQLPQRCRRGIQYVGQALSSRINMQATQMRTDSKQRWLAIVLAGVILGGWAADSPSQAALAIADAMRVTETFRVGLKMRARQDVERGGNSQQELDCLEAADLSFVKITYAEALARLLTQAELNEVLKFFSSPVGKRYLAGALAESLSSEERAALGEFLVSDAGAKISTELDTPQFRDQLFKRVSSVTSPCREGKTSAERFASLVPAPSPDEVRAAKEKFTPAAYDQVYALIRAMRHDELVVLALQQRVTANAARLPKQAATCAAGFKPSQFTDVIARPLIGQLSTTEVADALAFYRSKAGQQITQARFDEARAGAPQRPITDYITADQGAELLQFLKRPVARKLMEENVLEQKAIEESLAKQMAKVMDACLGKLRER